MVEFVTVTGPADWASYFINGDASGLSAEEKAQADAWLDREQIASVVSDATDEDGESKEARFTWSMRLYAPELDCSGGDVLDYVCTMREPAHV
jgi:hypothetical protein